ncbi:MAG: hypothetical protein SYC29_11415 [Planctomycetota bacterium]|nr:hypothetical protein [Planctomycetota bacterium]
MAGEPSHDHAPPPVKRSARKTILLAGCGVILALLLLLVVMNLDRSQPAGAGEERPAETGELVTPGGLTEEEQRLDRASEPGVAELGSLSGGWIQVADEEGELAQQYRFAHLDPNPAGMGDGWFRMTEPMLEIYARDGAVVTLRGDTALTYAPSQAIESGTLTGNVVIHRYDQIAGAVLDPARDEPSLLLRTAEASFDNILGEVRCDDEIHVEMTTGEFRGRGLKLLINDRENTIEHARVEALQFIRLAAPRSDDDRQTEPAPPAGRRAPAPDAEDADGDRRPPSRPPRAGAGADAKDDRPAGEEAAAPADIRFYRLTLHDEVEIVQGRAPEERRITGDSLSIVFTMESEGLGVMIAGRSSSSPPKTPKPARGERPAPAGPGTIEAMLAGAALTSFQSSPLTLAPPRREDDTIITCTGGLTMDPITNPDERLSSPRRARLDLVGDPVRISDSAGPEATCALLQYHLPAGRVELISSDRHGLHIHGPELQATAERFWLTESDQTGGFIGAGRAALVQPESDERGEVTAEAAPTDIAWRDRVDLDFDEASRGGMFRALRRARFHGAVAARSRDLSLSDLAGRGGTDRPAGGDRTGRLDCGELVVEFLPGRDEEIYARRVLALGDVAVTDDEQSLWAQSLDAYFNPPASAGEGAVAGAAGQSADLDHLTAEGAVQLGLVDGQRVFADLLQIDGGRRSAVLEGDDVRLVDGENVIDRARRITIDEPARRYVLEGKGRFRRFDRPVFAASDGRREAALLDHVPDRSEELRITWRDGVVVAPEKKTEAGEASADGPSIAAFRGNVQVVSPEMKLTHAEEMRLRFTEAEAGSSSIEAIEAIGSVRAHSVGEEGEISCDRLRVDLTEGAAGQALPRRMDAEGGVRIADANQRMWAESLIVTFTEMTDEETAGSDRPAPRAGEFADARVAVDTIEAEGDVQVRPAGGERVFADRLIAQAADETAELFGERVLIVSDEFILDRCTHVLLERQSGAYEVQGPGRFLAFSEPIPRADVDGRIEPPTPAGDRSIEARWTGSAMYQQEPEGGGALELRGDVDVESRPSPRELNTAVARILTLQFTGPTDGEGDRELERLLARGEARLENRSWLTEDHSDRPRVFYIGGQHIDYNQQTLEAQVVGAGELLIRDLRAEDAAADEPSDRPSPDDAFATKGTTLFRWQEQLQMTREVDDRFNIEMSGNVECLHENLGGRTTTLTGQRLIAGVLRHSAGAPARAEQEAGSLNFGGRMEVQRLFGHGSLYIRTAERDVACDEFDYNTATGLATLTAAPGRTVSILTQGAMRPYHAEHVLWNMGEDRITITRGAGAGAP